MEPFIQLIYVQARKKSFSPGGVGGVGVEQEASQATRKSVVRKVEKT